MSKEHLSLFLSSFWLFKYFTFNFYASLSKSSLLQNRGVEDWTLVSSLLQKNLTNSPREFMKRYILNIFFCLLFPSTNLKNMWIPLVMFSHQQEGKWTVVGDRVIVVRNPAQRMCTKMEKWALAPPTTLPPYRKSPTSLNICNILAWILILLNPPLWTHVVWYWLTSEALVLFTCLSTITLSTSSITLSTSNFTAFSIETLSGMLYIKSCYFNAFSIDGLSETL